MNSRYLTVNGRPAKAAQDQQTIEYLEWSPFTRSRAAIAPMSFLTAGLSRHGTVKLGSRSVLYKARWPAPRRKTNKGDGLSYLQHPVLQYCTDTSKRFRRRFLS
jgi:hypothetical protein